MRFLGLIFFSIRQIGRTFVVYYLTALLPLRYRSRLRYRNARFTASQTASFFQARAGIFIKAAQFVRNISNLFEEDISDQFNVVIDTVQAEPLDNLRGRIVRELGRDVDEVFVEIEEEAIAAASIGQVHRARLADGRQVAVKLLHSGLEHQTRQDIKALRLATGLVRRAWAHLDFTRHLQEFTHMVSMEMDFKNEAENLRRFRHNFADDERIVFPAVIEEASGHHIMTTEFIEGIAIDDPDALRAAGVDFSELSHLLMQTYIRMIFEHRFFHADPHPGNIAVLPADGLNPVRLVFYDFGAAEHITPTMMKHIQTFLFILRDRSISYLVDLAMDAGFLDRNANREGFQELFEIIYARYGAFSTENYAQIDPLRLGRVFTFRDVAMVNMRFRDLVRFFHVPRRYLYLARTLTYLMAAGKSIDPNVNIFKIARPYIDRHLIPSRRRLREMFRRGSWTGTFEKLMAGYYRFQFQRNQPVQLTMPPSNGSSFARHFLLSVLVLATSLPPLWLFDQGFYTEGRVAALLPACSFLLLFFSLLRSK